MTKHGISVKSQQFRKDAEPVAPATQKQETSFREEPNQQIWFLLGCQWSKEKENVIKINKIFFIPPKEAAESSSYRSFRKQARQVSYVDSLGVPTQLHQREVAL